jgi:hypothetical protein
MPVSLCKVKGSQPFSLMKCTVQHLCCSRCSVEMRRSGRVRERVTAVLGAGLRQGQGPGQRRHRRHPPGLDDQAHRPVPPPRASGTPPARRRHGSAQPAGCTLRCGARVRRKGAATRRATVVARAAHRTRLAGRGPRLDPRPPSPAAESLDRFQRAGCGSGGALPPCAGLVTTTSPRCVSGGTCSLPYRSCTSAGRRGARTIGQRAPL